jgi:hypothetical protein
VIGQPIRFGGVLYGEISGRLAMRIAFAVLLLPLALAGCLSFSSSSPSPPAQHTTIVTPSGQTQ